MNPQELKKILAAANAARREGYSVEEIDAFLSEKYGLSYYGLVDAVKALPPEKPSRPLATEDLLQLGLSGATLGLWEKFLGEMNPERRARLEEVRQTHPAVSRLYEAMGGTVTGGLAGAAAKKLATGLLMRAPIDLTDLATLPFVGATAGRALDPQDRARGAATGAAAGLTAAATRRAIPRPPAGRKGLGLGRMGLAAAGGSALWEFLRSNILR